MKKIALITDYRNPILLEDTRYLYTHIQEHYDIEVFNFHSYTKHDFGVAIMDYGPDLILSIGVYIQRIGKFKTIIWDYFGDMYHVDKMAGTCDAMIICNKDKERAIEIKKSGIKPYRLYPIRDVIGSPKYASSDVMGYDCFMYLNDNIKNKIWVRHYMRLFYSLILCSKHNPSKYSDFEIFSNVKMLDHNCSIEDFLNYLGLSKTAFIFNDFKTGFNYPMLFKCARYNLAVITNNKGDCEFDAIMEVGSMTYEERVCAISNQQYAMASLALQEQIRKRVDDSKTVSKLKEIIHGYL